jgi:hypothetical protein
VPVLIVLLALMLSGCAAFCPTPVATAPGTAPQLAAVSPCQTAIDKLQAQDTALKATVESTAAIAKRQLNARTIQSNLKVLVGPMQAACPSDVSTNLVPQVNARIQQIDGFLATGLWQGPVG